jgi:hypothetical protein
MSLNRILCRWSDETPDITTFTKTLHPEWIEEALNSTGTATIRSRKLPAEKVVWLVIGMALFTDRSIKNVVEHLKLAMSATMAASALTQARRRLTSSPLRWLFERVALAWNCVGEVKWRGLSLYGVDGCHQRIDDSKENHEHFGRPGGRAPSGYPQARYVALMNLTTRLLAAAEIGKWCEGEVTLAERLWPKIPDNSLTIVDRGFLIFNIFHQILSEGKDRHFLCRAKSNTKFQIAHEFPDGSVLARIGVSSAARKQNPELPRHLTVRVIAYHHPGGVPGLLITSLLNYEKYPSSEIVAIYHKRWELEVGFDEVKTHMLRRREALRSKTPEGVYQEFWGVMLAYNLVRREMLLVARRQKVAPNRISFTGCLLLIQNFFLASPMAAPGKIPKFLADLDEDIAALELPLRRSERRFPRQVKIKMSNYLKAPMRHAAVALIA